MKGGRGKGVAKVTKEAVKTVDDRKVGKRKAAAKVDITSKRKAKKAKKDPNKPKRPPSAFFVFLEEFRQNFKKDNPHVTAVSAVGKAAGEKWKSLAPHEKAPYETKAAQMKAEHGKHMDAYNKKQDMADHGDVSDKSKSEVNDEEEDAIGEEELKQEEEEEEEDDD